jgi:hypothetical protein
MAGLDPAIHVPATRWSVRKGVDHRVKPGDDDAERDIAPYSGHFHPVISGMSIPSS